MRHANACAALIVFLAVLATVACTGQDVLLPKSGMVPAGVDLTGRWRLRQAATNDELAAAARAAAAADGIPLSSGTSNESNRRAPDRRANRDSLVHMFLETGLLLKITQTPHGLFVSFDRAVVEEYRFGENRTVSVGPVEAQRVSGWVDGAYVIETLDEENNKLVERYVLEDEGRVLRRQVSISKGGKTGLAIEQSFDRQ